MDVFVLGEFRRRYKLGVYLSHDSGRFLFPGVVLPLIQFSG